MISVIILTFNMSESLSLTLKSLISQSLKPGQYEIIIVDNGSTDKTKHVAQSAVAAHPTHCIRYIYEPVPGLLSGRHRGALEARNGLLVFVDHDIDADYEWLQAIVDTFHDPAIHLVGGRSLPKYESSPPEWIDGFWSTTPYGGKACPYLSLLDLGDRKLDIDANYIWGLNFAIRKQCLFNLGGFHPDCIPDHLQHFQGDGETGLTMKANQKHYRSVYQPKALVYHRVSRGRLTPEYFKKRAFYKGVCDSYTAIRLQYNGVPRKPNPNFLESIGCHFHRYTSQLTHYVNGIARRLYVVAFYQNCLELKNIKLQVLAAYQAGYAFHQNAVRKYPDLLDWILREDYWDYQLPQFVLQDSNSLFLL